MYERDYNGGIESQRTIRKDVGYPERREYVEEHPRKRTMVLGHQIDRLARSLSSHP